MLTVRKLTILGSGLMGHGIAQIASQVGKYEVNLRDVEQKYLDNGILMINKNLNKLVKKKLITEDEKEETLSRIKPTLDLKEAVEDADLIIEAIPEVMELKKNTYNEVDLFAPSDAIIASNTSSISITALGSNTNRPEKVCGMHFFNPPQLMQLVEVIKGSRTSLETVEIILDVAHKMGKETVLVKKDCPGFIVNRILIPALNEAAAIYWEGVADRDDIDKAVKLGLNWPMGPLMLIDFIGADTTLAIAEVLEKEKDPKFHPCVGLKQMVKAGLLGRKRNKGYYDWIKK